MYEAASAQSPLQPPSPPTPRPRQPGWEEEEQCSVCREALSDPQVHLDCCTHSLHLPCFCALHVWAETELRCPTCRAIATVDQSDRRTLQEHSDEVISAAFTTARTGMPEREERTARRARFAVGGDEARGSCVISAAYTTEWWRTGPMYGWSVHVVCASSVRLGSWRTQLMAETDRPRSHSRAPPHTCLLYTSPSPRDGLLSRMPSSA